MAITVDARNLRLVTLHEVDEHRLHVRPSHALVIAQAPQGIVLVLNRRTSAWELPGGYIDTGETPRDAAMREFTEETGLPAPALRWRGVVELEKTTGRNRRRRRMAARFASLADVRNRLRAAEVLPIAGL